MERGRRADRQRLREEQARVGAVASVDDGQRDRIARREDEVEDVVGRQRIGAGADHPAYVRSRERELREGHRRRRVGRHRGPLGLNLVAVDRQRHRNVREQLVAFVAEAGSHGDPLLPRESGPSERHRGHREIHRARRRHRHGADRHPLGEMHFFRSGPAGSLEVADEDRLPAFQRRPAQDALRKLQRGAIARRSGSHFRGVDGAFEPPAVRRRAHVLFGISRKQRERRPVVRAHAADHAPRRLTCFVPVVAVAHAGRLIEEDDDIARAAAHRGRRRAPAQERSRERGDDERHRRRAEQQQEPVPDAPAADGLVRNAPHEHQRRELHHAFPLALNQMEQHRHGDRAQSEHEEWSEERHQG